MENLTGTDIEEKLQKLEEENNNLRIRLSEAEETLEAIQTGAVDALVINAAEDKQVYTLQGADYSYRVLVESMNEGVIMMAPDYSIFYSNRRIAKILRTSAENINGKGIDWFIYPEDLPLFKTAVSTPSAEKAIELRLVAADGRVIPVLFSCRFFSEEKQGIWLIFTDLTELKNIQDELVRTNEHLEELVQTRTLELRKKNLELKDLLEKLELALEGGKAGVWEWIMETDELYWDKNINIMFGTTKNVKVRKYKDFEVLINDEDLPHVRNAIKNALQEGMPYDTIFRIKSNNSETKYLNSKAKTYRDRNGKPVRMLGICMDVTELKNSTDRVLFKLNDELLRSNKELEQFAYVASHDLQEPLRMVSSFTQLLAKRYKDQLDQNAQEYIAYAVNGAKRMYEMINGLLAYSRINTRGKSLAAVDMQDVFSQVVQNLSLAIAEKNAAVTADKLPVVKADEAQMVQLIQNLVSNAVKFSRDTPAVHISWKSDRDWYVFSVKDNGVGIEKEYFGKIFMIFQRLQTTQEFTGTGIGLAICKRIVERHGGEIWIESQLGEGSTFYFTILK